MLAWKPNWNEAQQHFIDWWKHDGFVLTVGTHPRETPREQLGGQPVPELVAAYEDGLARARRNHAWLASQNFPGDSLPISSTDIGPGSLALALGSEPGFSPETVWFEPCLHEVAEPESLPPLLDAVGPKGMYIMMWPRTPAEAEQALAIAAEYR